MTEPVCDPTPATPAPNLFSLKEKVALVTGGTRGIGAACAIALAQAGARICLVQRGLSDTQTRDTIHALVSPASNICEIVLADLADPTAVREVFGTALELMGGDIHILVNCAGIQRRAPAVDFSESDWNDVIQTNLTSCFQLAQAAGKHMVPRRRGKIINFASLLTFQGGVTVPAYAAAKGEIASMVPLVTHLSVTRRIGSVDKGTL
ncbi:hypothetical protein FRB99_007164 [Tulasnella sp. 403]|nr:hypothetical protein FRB99_007164 [Tulasnella sp. 403]